LSAAKAVSVWRVAADTPYYTADALTGEGARLTGGRWNRKGTPLVYAAGSISLAVLETLAHLELGGLPLNRYLVRLDIPLKVWNSRTVFEPEKNIGWDALPAGLVSLDAGDDWLRQARTALMQVPSVIVPEEFNILINPEHKDSQALRVTKLRRWSFDARLGV